VDVVECETYRRREPAAGLPDEQLDAVGVGGGDHQIGDPVAVEVARRDVERTPADRNVGSFRQRAVVVQQDGDRVPRGVRLRDVRPSIPIEIADDDTAR